MFNKPLSLISNPKNQEFIAFAAIIALASFLRFYMLPFNMPFIGDQAKDYLVAYDMVQKGHVPLLGIESSMPQFRQGPVYIWLLAVFFAFFGFNPEYTGYLAATLGICAVGALYIYTRQYVGRRVALLAALILAVSPLAVIHSQMAFIVNAIPLVSVFFLVGLIKYQRKSAMSLFWPAVLFGLLFQFELASAPLILMLGIAYVIKPSKQKTNSRLIPAMKGLIVGLLPQIVYDITHQFRQMGYFLAWIGYRLVSFFGYRAEHQFSTSKLSNTLDIFKTYLHKFISWDNELILILTILLLMFGFFTWFKRNDKFQNAISFGWWWIIILTGSYIVHNSPSEAYFPALFVPISLVLAWTINQIRHPIIRFSFVIGVCLVALSNSLLFTRSHGLTAVYQPTTFITQVWLPRLDVQVQAIELIKQQVSEPINFRSTDPGAKFPAYLDNYRYLAQWQGIKQSTAGVDVWINRSIYEPNVSFTNHLTYEISGLTIHIPLK